MDGDPRPTALCRGDARAGFSLIEALVALAVAGAIFAAIGQIAAQAFGHWTRGERSIAALEMVTRGLGRLGADLAQALPERAPGSDDPAVLFRGGAASILFVAATGLGAGHKGVELIAVETVLQDEGTSLVRRRGPVIALGSRLEDPVSLVRGRFTVRFAYRDSAGQRHPTWSGRPTLPVSVDVELVGVDGTPVLAAPLVMPLAANIAVRCIGGEAEDKDPDCPGAAKPPPPATTPPPQVTPRRETRLPR